MLSLKIIRDLMKKSINEKIKEKLLKVQKEIDSICISVGRDPLEIKILPVTKTRTIEEVRVLSALGYSEFGENLVKEAKSKFFDENSGLDFNPQWVMIGHLQSNKVKTVVKYAKEIHSVDSIKIARILDKELKQNNKTMKALIQVNTSKEKSKYGFTTDNIIKNLKELAKLENIKFEGFMTLAIHSQNESEVRSCFRLLKEIQRAINDSNIFSSELERLSMGMSSDYKIAIEEGATEIRLGQIIFGPRSQPDSFYWP